MLEDYAVFWLLVAVVAALVAWVDGKLPVERELQDWAAALGARLARWLRRKP